MSSPKKPVVNNWETAANELLEQQANEKPAVVAEPKPAVKEEVLNAEAQALANSFFKKNTPVVEPEAKWEDELVPTTTTTRTTIPEALPQEEVKQQTVDLIVSTVYSRFFDSEPSRAALHPTDPKFKQRVVSFVDIPAGTVLFRGERLPDEGEDLRNFYRDFLGSIEAGPAKRFCMPPTYNVFFYPFPYVAFGAEDYGERFNALQMYVTRKKITLACMIGPSDKVRGSPKGYDIFMPIMRCNNVYKEDEKAFESVFCGATGDRKDKKLDAMSYDNCLNPYYMDILLQKGSQEIIPLNGWMAIAERDSFDAFEGRGRNKRTVKKGKNLPMGAYLKELEGRFPGKVGEVLSWMYTDQAGHRGFPEISLYPMSPHPGTETQYIDAPTMDSALDYIEKNSDKFVYLPLACFTATQTLDGLESDYVVTNIPKENRKRFPKEGKEMRKAVRKGIEKQVDAYMTRFMTEGIEIPGIGLSKIVFDPRTGFYVIDSFIRKKNPHIWDITKQFEDGSYSTFPYLNILMSLETPEDRKIAMDYCIIYNRFNQDKLFNPELLYQEGPVVYRSFIFTRPANYRELFTNINSRFPLNLKKATNRATFKFKVNKMNHDGMLEKGFTEKELGLPQTQTQTQTKTKTRGRGMKGGRYGRTRKQRRSIQDSIMNENLGLVQETLLLGSQ